MRFIPRPLYVAAIASGLAAGLCVVGRRDSGSDVVAQTMEAQRLRDRHEAIIVGGLEDTHDIKSLSSEQREEIRRLLREGSAHSLIACSILGSVSSSDVMEDFVPALASVYHSDPQNSMVPWTLTQWKAQGGAAIIGRLADGQGPLADLAKEVRTGGVKN